MKYKPEQEQELLADILTFGLDPYSFVIYAFPWGVENTPLAQHDGPRKWQESTLLHIRDHTTEAAFRVENGLPAEVYREVVRSGRGVGKSALFGWLSMWHASTHIGSSTIVTANTESQLRTKTFPEFSKWFTLAINAHWFDVDSMKIQPREWISKMVREQLSIDPRYWYIQGQNWSEENPDAFAGTHNAYGLKVLFDEASNIAEPIWKVTNGFFTEYNPYRYWLAFSNPRRNAGAFYNRCMANEFKGTWRRQHVDATKVEGVDKSIYQSILDEYGEHSDTALVEVYGEFPEAGDDQLIPNSVVRAAQNREIEAFDDYEPLIMGVDPAPRGRTVVRFRQGRDARSIPPLVLHNKDNEAIADEIVRLMNKYDADGIAVDAGQGTGVIDILKRKRVKVHEVWFGMVAKDKPEQYATEGTELWYQMADWLKGACIDKSDTLFRDLTSRTWRWHGREDSKKILTSKREMQRDGIPSPDDGDALALTFYPRLPRRNKRARMLGQQGTPIIAKDMDYPILG